MNDMGTIFSGRWHWAQIPVFLIGAGVGDLVPMIMHFMFGLVLLPLPQAIQNTPSEDEIVRCIFALSSYSSVSLGLVFTVLLLLIRRRLTFWFAVFLAGITCGATWHVVQWAPRGFNYIMR